MMQKTAEYLYTEEKDCQILLMPYKGRELAMAVFLPKERFGLENLMKEMSSTRLLDLIHKTRSQKVQVNTLLTTTVS